MTRIKLSVFFLQPSNEQLRSIKKLILALSICILCCLTYSTVSVTARNSNLCSKGLKMNYGYDMVR